VVSNEALKPTKIHHRLVVNILQQKNKPTDCLERQSTLLKVQQKVQKATFEMNSALERPTLVVLCITENKKIPSQL
jgi:hypothetical protein